MPTFMVWAFIIIAAFVVLSAAAWAILPVARKLKWGFHWERFKKRHIIDTLDESELTDTEHVKPITLPARPLDNGPKDAYIKHGKSKKKGRKHGKRRSGKKNSRLRGR